MKLVEYASGSTSRLAMWPCWGISVYNKNLSRVLAEFSLANYKSLWKLYKWDALCLWKVKAIMQEGSIENKNNKKKTNQIAFDKFQTFAISGI